jgi:hypothetical protein
MMMSACLDAPNYPDEPEIDFISLSKTVMQQGSLFEDSTFVKISFTDGDGNLGDEDRVNIFLKDQRDTSETFTTFKIPFIPEEGAGNGISGEITLLLFTSCCIYDNGQAPCTPSTFQPTDTLVYDLYIEDRAGNASNILTLPEITLLCDQ